MQDLSFYITGNDTQSTFSQGLFFSLPSFRLENPVNKISSFFSKMRKALTGSHAKSESPSYTTQYRLPPYSQEEIQRFQQASLKHMGKEFN